MEIGAICDYIDAHPGEPFPLRALAQMAEMSPFHFARRFKAATGVTPRQYVASARLRMFKREVRADGNIAAATYAAGYGSSSRVYENLPERIGMTPGQYKTGGRGLEIAHAAFETALGTMAIGATDRGVCFLQFGESAAQLTEQLRAEFPGAALRPAVDSPELRQWIDAIRLYLAGASRALAIPLDPNGTAFQTRVWNYLLSIPRGEVRSYAEVASALGAPRAARAVANACASNRVALAIPCHRVLRSGGALAGYRWGLERKRALLDLERQDAATPACPERNR